MKTDGNSYHSSGMVVLCLCRTLDNEQASGNKWGCNEFGTLRSCNENIVKSR